MMSILHPLAYYKLLTGNQYEFITSSGFFVLSCSDLIVLNS